MRILHVIHRLDREAGGTSALAVSMCEGLARRGHDVSLYSVARDTAGGSAIPPNTHFYAKLFPSDLGPLGISLALVRSLAADIPRQDLIHIHMLYRLPQAFAAHFARRAGIPYCVQPHGALEPILFHKPERRNFKRLYEAAVERRNLAHAAGLIYTSAGERDATVALGLVPPAFVVPAGIDFALYGGEANTAAFRARYGLKTEKLVLWMGRITAVKALPVLANAFIALAAHQPDAVLMIAGPDQDGARAQLEKLFGDAGHAKRVIFTGMLLADDKLAALKAADLFVLPSYTENFGISAMEAMAVGCPVLVSDNVKIGREIVDQGAGLSVPVDAAQISAAMSALLDDTSRRAAMGAAALKLAQRHDWDYVAEKLEAAYAQMINGDARRTRC